jgi:hypothetical protein
MRKLIASLVVAAFCTAGSPAFAQLGAIKDGAKKAGEATVDTTKKGVDATEKGAKKVGEGTKNAVQTTYVCKDGKTDQATLKTNACKEHGGVKAEQKAKSKPKPKSTY